MEPYMYKTFHGNMKYSRYGTLHVQNIYETLTLWNLTCTKHFMVTWNTHAMEPYMYKTFHGNTHAMEPYMYKTFMKYSRYGTLHVQNIYEILPLWNLTCTKHFMVTWNTPAMEPYMYKTFHGNRANGLKFHSVKSCCNNSFGWHDCGRSGAVVKGVEHISTIVLVNIWVARVRVPLVLSVGIWICKNSTSILNH